MKAASARRSEKPRPALRPEPDRRQAVLQAALELMVERGFHGTAMPQIAERAKVGVGTLYRYFADKEDLGNTLYREGKAALAAALWHDLADSQAQTRSQAQSRPDGEDWQAQFQEIWRRLVGFARQRPLMLRFLELHYHAGYLDAQSLALEQRAQLPAHDYLQRAIGAGAVRRLPPPLLANMVWAMLIAACADADTLARPDLIDAAGQCAWAAIRQPQPDTVPSLPLHPTDRRPT